MNVIKGQIAASDFVKRQTAQSEFSHFAGTWDQLAVLVKESFDEGRIRRPGYRDGVVLVAVSPSRFGVTEFFSNIVQLKEGDKLAGEYKARQPGEEPRKQVAVVGGEKIPAKSVEIVLYRHDVLAEDDGRSCEAEWEIISINASPYEDGVKVPMTVGTMLANYFHLSGGTDMKLEDFERGEIGFDELQIGESFYVRGTILKKQSDVVGFFGKATVISDKPTGRPEMPPGLVIDVPWNTQVHAVVQSKLFPQLKEAVLFWKDKGHAAPSP